MNPHGAGITYRFDGETFDEEYVRVMSSGWNHPHNDQRPAVRRWLAGIQSRFQHMLDIGPGDAYYLELLRPSRYTIIEPNNILRRAALDRARHLGTETVAFTSVSAFLANHSVNRDIDLAVMIHVLFYLSLAEVQALLPRLRSKPLLLVYPWEQRAMTVTFEESIGLFGSRDRVRLKERLLPPPTRRELVHTHIVLPAQATVESIAFLLSHVILRFEMNDIVFRAAMEFAESHLSSWYCAEGFYKLPQTQVLETFNFGR
ncbi:MAG: hypothetical protein ACREYF_03355 [Gammaproteobacteria bacterium]